MRRLAATATALGALCLAAAPAQAESVFVTMGTSSFTPQHLDVLLGDTVIWRNGSLRSHDIRSESAGFDSGQVPPRASFAHAFGAVGTHAYVCTIHDGMSGEVGVQPLLLAGPSGPVLRGEPVALHVRALEGAGEVAIEEDAGTGFRPVAVAGPPRGGGHDGHIEPGTLHATVVPPGSATYRAVSAAGTSPSLRVEVTGRARLAVSAARTRGGRGALVRVKGTPRAPGARVVLQLRLRERFGWWPMARARLNSRSTTRFRVRRHAGARARVVSVGSDWATELSRSKTLRLPR